MDMASLLNRLKKYTAVDHYLLRFIQKTGDTGSTAPKRTAVADSITRKTLPNNIGIPPHH